MAVKLNDSQKQVNVALNALANVRGQLERLKVSGRTDDNGAEVELMYDLNFAAEKVGYAAAEFLVHGDRNGSRYLTQSATSLAYCAGKFAYSAADNDDAGPVTESLPHVHNAELALRLNRHKLDDK